MPESGIAHILGTRVSVSSFAAAKSLLEEHVARGGPATFGCANAHSLLLGVDDPEHRRRLNRTTYLMADGMPLVWLLRLRGFSAERVHGDDLLLACCRDHPEWGHFLLGGAEGQPEAVARELRRRFPEIRISGCRATPDRPVPAAESRAIAEQIRASGARMVWVGMGTPAQDAWMDAHAERVGLPLAGCGSAFDLLCGRTRGAPAWVKRAGLQWLLRLLQEPRRLAPRYLVGNPRFAWLAAREL